MTFNHTITKNLIRTGIYHTETLCTNKVTLPTRLKSNVRLSSQFGIGAFRKQQRARMPLVTFSSYSPIYAYH
nr:MAG TPA: hypothetical protein [Caudoviricetes sp.]